MVTHFLRPSTALAFGAAGVLALGACSSGSSEDGAAPERLNVFAAASLSGAGDDLESAFAEEHPGQQIEWNFAGSSALVRQIEQGAEADVFVSADEKNMDKALELPAFSNVSDRDEPQIVATNRLVLVTSEGNPADIQKLEDLSGSKADAKVAICAPEVPCGTAASTVLEDAKITLPNPSEEANVSSVATKIATGQVDAGFVYSSDAEQMKEQGKDVTIITLEGAPLNAYPAASLDDASPKAQEFAAWLRSEKAQAILQDFGFGAPEE